MKVIHKGKDISDLVSKLNWSGDYKQAARTIDLQLAVSPHDHYLPTVTILMGDLIQVLDDNSNEIFQGYVFFKEKSIDSNTMHIVAYDGLIYTLKSKGTYNFKNMTPQAITSRLCGEFGISQGKLASGGALSRLFESEVIYNIIMTAYTIESNKTGKLYMPRMNKGKLDVIEKGTTVAKYVLDSTSTIINSTYSESIENSVNRVKMYDEEGKDIGMVTLDGIPGVLQDIYKKEKGHNASSQARGMLKGMERNASIEALGNFDCITGNAVRIKEPYTGLSGLFYIDNDSHDFSDNQHTMRLGLSFKNIMDSMESGSVDEG